MTELNQSSFNSGEREKVLGDLMDFIRSSSILPDGIDLSLDSFSETLPSLAVCTTEGGSKKYNVIGGYEAEFPFKLLIRIAENASSDRIDAIKVLNELGTYFEKSTQNKQISSIDGRELYLKIEMTEHPYCLGLEEADQAMIYQAACRCIYKHKSQIE